MPENVIRDILLKLPVKSLMRCRCVCKSWCALIGSPFFVTQHLHIQSTGLIVLNGINADAHLLVFDDKTYDAVVETVSIPNPYDVEKMEVYPRFVGACNGIICVLCLKQNRHLFDSHVIELWNPATKEMKVLPMANITLSPQNRCPHFGFGFDAKTSDYKVVRIVHSLSPSFQDSLPPAVEVYSLNTDCWNEIDSQVPFFYFDMRWSGIYTYLDGFCYWGANNENGYVLLSFDMADEEFQMTPLPISKYFDVGQICLSVLKGSIALIVHCLDDPGSLSRLEIWLIDKDVKNSSWVKHFTVDFVPSLAPIFGVNDEILLAIDSRLVSYDLESQVVNSLVVTLPSFLKKFGAIVLYKESLVSVKTGKEQLHLQ